MYAISIDIYVTTKAEVTDCIQLFFSVVLIYTLKYTFHIWLCVVY